MGLATILRSRHFPYPVWLPENWRFRDARWLPGVYLVSKQQCPVHPSSRAPGGHLLNCLNTPSLPVHDGTSLLVESGYNGDKESLGTEKKVTWCGGLGWGHRRGSGEYGRKKGWRGALWNSSELMRLSRTWEDERNQRRDQAERFKRSMRGRGRGTLKAERKRKRWMNYNEGCGVTVQWSPEPPADRGSTRCKPRASPCCMQTSTCCDFRQAPLSRGDTHVRIVRWGPWGSAYNKNIVRALHTWLSVYCVSDGERDRLYLQVQTCWQSWTGRTLT